MVQTSCGPVVQARVYSFVCGAAAAALYCAMHSGAAPQHPAAAQPASSRARAGRPPAPLGRRGRLRPPKPTPAPPRRPPGWGAAVHRPLAERGLACSYTLLGGVVSPRRVMARDRRSSQRRRAGGRGRGRGGKRFKRPVRTAEDRESGRNQRKKPSWAWRVVFLSLLEGKSQCEIQRIFKAEDKAVSRYYIQSCLADFSTPTFMQA